jgi:GPI mannosyltransferase 3
MSGYSRDVFPLLFAFRMCNALVTHTYFNPDEYWQGPEIAHGMVFGHGYR